MLNKNKLTGLIFSGVKFAQSRDGYNLLLDFYTNNFLTNAFALSNLKNGSMLSKNVSIVSLLKLVMLAKD
jgi:hypothetical protein